MTKEEVLKEVESDAKNNYTKKNVLFLIEKISSSENVGIKRDETVRKYDVFINKIISKNRPFVVVKSGEKKSYCISLTTANCTQALIPYKSRFMKDGYIANLITVVSNELIRDNFIGIFEDKIALNASIRIIKREINKL